VTHIATWLMNHPEILMVAIIIAVLARKQRRK
jgi:hypothetical protein